MITIAALSLIIIILFILLVLYPWSEAGTSIYEIVQGTLLANKLFKYIIKLLR